MHFTWEGNYVLQTENTGEGNGHISRHCPSITWRYWGNAPTNSVKTTGALAEIRNGTVRSADLFDSNLRQYYFVTIVNMYSNLPTLKPLTLLIIYNFFVCFNMTLIHTMVLSNNFNITHTLIHPPKLSVSGTYMPVRNTLLLIRYSLFYKRGVREIIYQRSEAWVLQVGIMVAEEYPFIIPLSFGAANFGLFGATYFITI
jgi:hypothetical protein